MKILIYTFLALAFNKAVLANVGTSTYELQKLLLSELEFVKKLEQLNEEKFQSLLNQYYPLNNGSRIAGLKYFTPNEAEEHVANPLNALALVRRTSEVAEQLKDEDVAKNFTSIFPDLNAFYETCQSMALLQETYELDAQDLRKGQVRSEMLDNAGLSKPAITSSHPLDGTGMRYLGVTTVNNGWWDLGTEWLQMAHQACQQESCPDQQKIQTDLKKAIAGHDQLLDKKGPYGEKHRTFLLPYDPKLKKKKKYRNAKNAKSKRYQKTMTYLPLFKDHGAKSTGNNFHFICKNGPVWREPSLERKFRCRFQHHGDPYLKLGPIKLEELNASPFVVLFKDFLSDRETEYMKARAKDGMVRSSFGNGNRNAKKHVGKVRTSQQAWVEEKIFNFPVTDTYVGLHGDERFILSQDMDEKSVAPYAGEVSQRYMNVSDQTVFKITKRIGLATRTTLTSPMAGENYQVANYGLGGQYASHMDPLGYHNPVNPTEDTKIWYKATGDRFATFMAYLSDVQMGGGTVFPLLGLRSEPEKGSAVFWLNLMPHGHAEALTLHGGCPVLVGSKWITNKWISYYDQGLGAYPCDKNLKKDDVFQTWRDLQSPQI